MAAGDRQRDADALARLTAAFDELIRPGPYELTIDEVADATGVDVALARRLWLAMGFADPAPQERIGTALDVEAFRRALEQVETLGGIERLVRQTRVLSAAVARIAEVWVDDFRQALDRGVSPDDLVDLLADLDLDRLTWLIGYVHRHQLQAAVRRELGSRLPGRSGALRTVGFADLVGFTALSRERDAAELMSLVEAFERLAYETVAELGGRVVKTIGDEVMFTHEDVVAAVQIAVALGAAEHADGLPPLRAGLDRGPAFWFEGDLYGPAVNAASRVVGVADPGVVAVTSSVRDAHPEGARWPSLGVFDLHGIGAVELWAPCATDRRLPT